MYYHIFRTDSSLICHFPAAVTPLILHDDPADCFRQQMAFYSLLSDTDANRFTCFCQSPSSRAKNTGNTAVPSLLLMPKMDYTALFAERYTSQLLSRSDPIPGAIAGILGQPSLCTLKERFPRHHLILTLLFSTMADLYSAASPVLANVPPLVRSLVEELELLYDPSRPDTGTIPCLHAYRRERNSTDMPAFLDLYQILPRLHSFLSGTPLFSALQMDYSVSDAGLFPESVQVRCPVSAFLYIFVLLSYTIAILSDTETVSVSLYRDGVYACVTLFCETDRLALLSGTHSELRTLTDFLPEYTGPLTLLQYLLHRNRIPFACRNHTSRGESGLEFTLYLDTRFREEIEFRHADPDAQLAEALPDALALLRLLYGEESFI